jgi:hypothetical protein
MSVRKLLVIFLLIGALLIAYGRMTRPSRELRRLFDFNEDFAELVVDKDENNAMRHSPDLIKYYDLLAVTTYNSSNKQAARVALVVFMPMIGEYSRADLAQELFCNVNMSHANLHDKKLALYFWRRLNEQYPGNRWTVKANGHVQRAYHLT